MGLRTGHRRGWDDAWNHLTRSARKAPTQQPAGFERDGQAALTRNSDQPARVTTAQPVRVRRDPAGR